MSTNISSQVRTPLISFRHGDRDTIAAELNASRTHAYVPVPKPQQDIDQVDTNANQVSDNNDSSTDKYTDIKASNMRKVTL